MSITSGGAASCDSGTGSEANDLRTRSSCAPCGTPSRSRASSPRQHPAAPTSCARADAPSSAAAARSHSALGSTPRAALRQITESGSHAASCRTAEPSERRTAPA
eukprot:190903-Prymnesium_polylepis.1